MQENVEFENSCKTLISKKYNIFVSAFPGRIIFGEVNDRGFIKSKYFQFLHFEFFDLYISLLKIVKFFVSEEQTEEKGLILSNEDLSYYWLGKFILQNNKSTKFVVFAIEFKFETIFELLLQTDQFNDIIKCISETILSCLCLKTIEKAFFDFILKENTSLIVSLKNQKKCKTILEKFKKSSSYKITSVCEPNLIELVIYYNELLIIVQKLRTMINHEMCNEDLRITTLLES